MPWRKGHSPLSAAPEYEDYLFEQWSHGIFDDFWKQPGIYAEGYYDRYADVPVVNLSGWYDPYARTAVENYLGLSRAEARPGAADPRSVDPWRPLVDLCRRRRFRPGGSGRRQSRRGFLRIAPALVRPLGQGRSPTASTTEPAVRVFVMGGGSGRRNRGGPARPRREVADGRRLAVAADPVDEVLPACRPQPRPRVAGRRRAAARLRLRSAQSGADDRRRAQLGRAGHARRRLRPAKASAAQRADVLAVLDAAARPRPGGHRTRYGAAVDRLRRPRYGFHGKADRCASAERGLTRTALR